LISRSAENTDQPTDPPPGVILERAIPKAIANRPDRTPVVAHLIHRVIGVEQDGRLG
jgi:hypothetical protein